MPRQDAPQHLEEGIDELPNQLRRTYYFSKHPTATHTPHPFKQKSQWKAPRSHLQLEQFISTLKDKADELPHIHIHNNLTKEEHKALHELANNPSITIKMADKGSKIVVQDTAEYIHTGTEHLNDTSIYAKLDSDPTLTLHEHVGQFIDSLYDQRFIDTTTKAFLTKNDPARTQQIYFLKNLHKNPIAVGPIVSGIGGINEEISAFLDHYLQPIVFQTPSYLKNTKELLKPLLLPPTQFWSQLTLNHSVCLSHRRRARRLAWASYNNMVHYLYPTTSSKTYSISC